MMHDHPLATPSLSALTQEGEKFYLEHLRKKLEAKHLGEYVVIEPIGKTYVINEDLLMAIKKAQKKHPNKFFTIIKIGTFKPPVNNYKQNSTPLEKNHAWAF